MVETKKNKESKENMPFQAVRFLDTVKEQLRLYEVRICEAAGSIPQTYEKVYPPPFKPTFRPTYVEISNQFQTEQLAICDVVREYRFTAQFNECFTFK